MQGLREEFTMTTLEKSAVEFGDTCLLATDGASSFAGLHVGWQLQQIWRIVALHGLPFHVRSAGRERCPDGSSPILDSGVFVISNPDCVGQRATCGFDVGGMIYW